MHGYRDTEYHDTSQNIRQAPISGVQPQDANASSGTRPTIQLSRLVFVYITKAKWKRIRWRAH